MAVIGSGVTRQRARLQYMDGRGDQREFGIDNLK